MKFDDIIKEENILLEEILIESPVAMWQDRAGQLAGVRNANEKGFDRLGRAVVFIDNKGNVNVKVGSMNVDHNDLGKNGLRFFWGIKGKTFLFTGKNKTDLDDLYRKDKILAGQGSTKPGQVFTNVIGEIMKNKMVKADITPEFKKSLINKLKYEGVIK